MHPKIFSQMTLIYLKHIAVFMNGTVHYKIDVMMVNVFSLYS